jgi:hypothetical protein
VNGYRLETGAVMRSYRKNIGDVTDSILESDLAQKVMALAERGFKDRTKKLAEEIRWETSPEKCKELIGELRLLAPAIARKNILLDTDRILNGYKVVLIEKRKP